MHPSAVLESLERRDHFAASPKLDPHYFANADGLIDVAGQNLNVYQAVPGPGGRTYVLAQRYAAGQKKSDIGYANGLLTIAAYGADGKLDPAFGTRGVVLTDYVTQGHFDFITPGVLRTDDIGRVYFADDTRVLRLHADGTVDRTFGTNGVATYAAASQPVALCDVTPNGSGVLVATTRIRNGVQQFAAQQIGRHTKTVWTAAHKTGVTRIDSDGTYGSGGDTGAFQYLAQDQAQFARSRSGLVLVRIDTDEAPYVGGSADTGPVDTVGATDQRMVVTRFDAAGHGTDAMTADLGVAPYHTPVTLRTLSDGYGMQNVADHGPLLSPSGRVLTVQGGTEIYQLRLNGHGFSRLSTRSAAFGQVDHDVPDVELLADGNVYVTTQVYDPPGTLNYTVQEYAIDADFTGTKAVGGPLSIPNSAFGTARTDVETAEPFIGEAGRLYFYAGGETAGTTPTLAIRRV